MDGIEILRRPKSAWPDVPVIMVTAFAMDEKSARRRPLPRESSRRPIFEAARLIHETLKGMKGGRVRSKE
jgi:CheY-like chemotaxis protein